MLFNSYEFLFLFLPLVLLGYYFLFARRGRVVFLTLMSYAFYGWWDYRFCSLMLISTLIDYVAGHHIAKAKAKRRKQFWLVVSLATNLGLLGFFKYFDLFASTVNSIFLITELSNQPIISLLNVVLPVGISFYTFQSMSYSIDIYRGIAHPVDRFWNFACYVSLFPQLIAGPIVRYHELEDQLRNRTHTWEKAATGISFFILGLAKKVIIADSAALLVRYAFETAAPTFSGAWAGVLGYTAQIYFDFSGYSDMAVGLGLLLGFQFPQNFNSPYKAVSITDFWRRWHISLSSWLRDYLYIPLGGNRKGEARTYANLIVTMLLGGLWHGASWTFVIWGAYHGCLLAIERTLGKRHLLDKAPHAVQRIWTFLLVMIGWVFFRCDSLEQAGAIFRGMVGLNTTGHLSDLWSSAPIGLIGLTGGLFGAWFLQNTWDMKHKPSFIYAVWLCVLFAACVGIILVNTSSPFLYFQF